MSDKLILTIPACTGCCEPPSPCCDPDLSAAYALDFDFIHAITNEDCNELDPVTFHVAMELDGTSCLWSGTITIGDYTFDVTLQAIDQSPDTPPCAYDLTIGVTWMTFAAQGLIHRPFTAPESPVAVFGDTSGQFNNPCVDTVQMLGCEIS